MSNETIEIFENHPVNYATFWERLAAAFIDGILVSIVNYGILFAISDDWMQPPFYLRIINIIIGVSYFAYFESSEKQATFGKQAMNIKVTSMSGERISFKNAIGRYFAKIVSAIIIFIGYLMMLWDDKKQTLHDKMASTLVVKK